LLLLLLATVALPRAAAGQDAVLEWNTHLNTAVLAGGTGPLPATRVTAMVQAAVFDAVNGIARRYPSVHVAGKGHGGASQEAAAIQAAYAMLVRIYPLQAATLLAKRNASLGALGLSHGEERRGAVERGVAWGQEVADAIGRGVRPMASRPILRRHSAAPLSTESGARRLRPIWMARDRTSPR
jgi:hypothetical protein